MELVIRQTMLVCILSDMSFGAECCNLGDIATVVKFCMMTYVLDVSFNPFSGGTLCAQNPKF